MPVQAIPLALIASLYPLGIAALLLVFEAARPRARSAAYFIGAATCTLTIGFAVVFLLRAGGIHQAGQSTPRYGTRLAFGIGFLAAALVMSRRPAKPKRSSDQPSRITAAISRAGLATVFVIGVVMYLPSPTYLSALDIVGSTKMITPAAVVWVVIVVAVSLITIEVPVALYWLAPEWTTGKLKTIGDWLDHHGRTMLIGVLFALGLWLTIESIVGLLPG
ncbi:MAG: GAP family protein [Mycobacterium sp.]|nr:GAP family protein [Mycobacterium sp.]